jgi:TDG/mug DNA glycosylase family protein
MVPDIIAPGLDVLFCGINPGLYSGAVGHHFARPGNRFWAALHQAGFTNRLLSPFEEQELLSFGLGVTNLVSRATRAAADLSPDELRRGTRRVERSVERYRPRLVAFLGLGAYRSAFHRPRAAIGPQPEPLTGAGVWLLANPSGAQARYQLPELVEAFSALRRAAAHK